MRLIKASSNQEWSMTADLPASPAPYAILSHTWGADHDEVTFKDVQEGSGIHRPGSAKLQFCARQANEDELEFFWIDTCCIDRTNHVELSEAITSMFRWYRQAEKCYVYLSDVSADSQDSENTQARWKLAFRNSRWFTRGWTLQELLAPATVEFYSREGKWLGSKKTLESLIHDITQIPIDALRGQSLSQFSIDERLRWTKERHTRKVEDRAYCLLGLFGVSMSLRYGEGEDALSRLEKKVKGLSKMISTYVIDTWNDKDAENPELINWLAPSRSRELHARTSKARHPGTGLYFTEGPLISWLRSDSDYGSLIEIMGKSGTGKTTLFSHIVDATEAFASEQPTTAFAYHYCAFSDPESQRLINILGSLVVQISAWQPGIFEDVRPVFERDRERKQVKTLQTWELEQTLVKYGTRLSTVVLLFDALNESEDFFETCACIGRLLQQLPRLKVLVTSTIRVTVSGTSQDIRVSRIQIDPLDDIQAFVNFNLNCHVTLSCLSAECKDNIRTALFEKADQSFRWVSLVLDSLGRERTERGVSRVLTQIPGDLHNVYAKMFGKIPVADRAIAREVLLWVCFAMRPMTLLELSEAAILEDCEGVLNPQTRLFRPAVILEICHGFLDYEDSSGKVKLAHSSVKDYFLSQHIRDDDDAFIGFTVDQGNRILMRRCLTYLLLDNFKTGAYWNPAEVVTRQQEYPLLDYATHYWGFHASHASESEWILARQLFSTRSLPAGGNYGVWGSCMMPHWSSYTIVRTGPLYFAASVGMYPLVKALVSINLDSGLRATSIEDAGGSRGSTALQVACFRGRKWSARCLVKAGANFWADDPGSGRPAWFWAKCNGWEEVIKDMIQRKPELARRMNVDQTEVRWARGYQRIWDRSSTYKK